MLRSAGRFEFGVSIVRVLPHNDDHTVATPDNVFSSSGPWDFSGVDDISAVPLYTRVDAGDLITRLVDLSGAADSSAVTAQELYEAIVVSAATGYSEFDIRVTSTGDTRVTTGGDVRILASPIDFFAVVGDQIQVTAPSASYWIQVFGECAEVSGFGQGYGLRMITADTIAEFRQNKRDVGSDISSTRDGRGEVTEMIGSPRHGGRTIQIIDTATDYNLISMIDQQGLTFYMESYTPAYPAGQSKESDPVGYVQEIFYSCVGRSIGPNRRREIANREYELTATKGGGYGTDYLSTVITPTEYKALDLAEY